MVLPAFGMVSEIIPVFARKPIFGYRALAAATAGIAFFGLLVWGHHMFATPMPVGVLGFFMFTSLLVAVPTGIKIFNWLATLWRGSIEFRVPLLFVVGAIAQFVVGGATGVILAVFPVDWQLTDTYFVVAHMHHVLFGGVLFMVLGGLYYWFPKMSGRLLARVRGKWTFWLLVIGFNLTFLPQYSAGMSGMPRRVDRVRRRLGSRGLQPRLDDRLFRHRAGPAGHDRQRLLGPAERQAAGHDPWRANTLEWFTPSPPPAHNFDVIPTVRSLEPMKDYRRRALERGQRSAERQCRRPRRSRRRGDVRAAESPRRADRLGRRLSASSPTRPWAMMFLLIVVGGVVRVSDSGLGCGAEGSGTDGWPLCAAAAWCH